MKYQDLDINQRINLKGTYTNFLRIAMERFKGAQDKYIYNRRVKGKRSLTSRRTKHLQTSMTSSFKMMAANTHHLNIHFSLYGRFVDMGVGRGVDKTTAILRKQYTVHRDVTPRIPKPWYSKVRYREERKINEILLRDFGFEGIRLVESILTERQDAKYQKTWRTRKKGVK